MEKEKLIKAKYLKPTIEIYPLLKECVILAATGRPVNETTTITPSEKKEEDIDLGSGGSISITSEDGDVNIGNITITNP
ncbi:hypothetical protein [Prevotella amnii]|jgi:hypothetical protein|uniref:Uncharacterized protein n=1 Tax=Prevotella amnii DNF00058 TaxID=1401066 RepID=A0A096D3S2_9BACT|nr:hypothetical protein [Prevotella amnii]KGF52174.1 hypothetical protein HMPREF9302_04745 [Prevotella amnii DNF00058]